MATSTLGLPRPTALKVVRERRGIAVSELAKAAGVSRQTIYSIEDGSFVPNTLVALRLARTLEVSVEELFSLEEQAPSAIVEAELLSNQPALQVSGQLVRLYELGSKKLALPVQASFNYLPFADGLASSKSGRTVQVQTLGPNATRHRNRSEEILIAGCDPGLSLLAEAGRLHGIELAVLPASSRQALEWLSHGQAHIAGSHLFDSDSGEYNLPAVRKQFPAGGVRALTFAEWETGLLVQPRNPKKIRSVSDLSSAAVTIVNREKGSGSRAQLDSALKKAGIPATRVKGYGRVVYGHLPAAFGVANGWADCCLATRSAARCFGLEFLPLRSERFDLIFSEHFLGTKPGQAIADLLSRSTFRQRLASLAGYETARTGSHLLF